MKKISEKETEEFKKQLEKQTEKIAEEIVNLFVIWRKINQYDGSDEFVNECVDPCTNLAMKKIEEDYRG